MQIFISDMHFDVTPQKIQFSFWDTTQEKYKKNKQKQRTCPTLFWANFLSLLYLN